MSHSVHLPICIVYYILISIAPSFFARRGAVSVSLYEYYITLNEQTQKYYFRLFLTG